MSCSRPRPPPCPLRCCSGEGSGRGLRVLDLRFPTSRQDGVAWGKGVDPLTLLGLLRGASNGGRGPREKRFSLYPTVIGSQTLHATGYAMGVQKEGAVGDAGG